MPIEETWTTNTRIVNEAVSEAVHWGRSWSDQWYYKMPAHERAQFEGGFTQFVEQCSQEYAKKIAD